MLNLIYVKLAYWWRLCIEQTEFDFVSRSVSVIGSIRDGVRTELFHFYSIFLQ